MLQQPIVVKKLYNNDHHQGVWSKKVATLTADFSRKKIFISERIKASFLAVNYSVC
jgi:hypothetical protein